MLGVSATLFLVKNISAVNKVFIYVQGMVQILICVAIFNLEFSLKQAEISDI